MRGGAIPFQVVGGGGISWDSVFERFGALCATQIKCAPQHIRTPPSASPTAVSRRGNHSQRLVPGWNEMTPPHFVAAVTRLSSLKRAHDLKRNASVPYVRVMTSFLCDRQLELFSLGSDLFA